MISRRRALVPLAAALATPALVSRAENIPQADKPQADKPAPAAKPPQPEASKPEAPKPEATKPGAPALPARYDEPLGIGLEGWPYPAPLKWRPLSIGGQSVRMGYMDIWPVRKNRYRTVVLLHGRNFDSSYWAGPIKDLSEAGFRVIVPDQIGFHKSSKPDVAYSLDMLAEHTIGLLAGLQLEKTSFIGHSFGGMLGVRIAASYPQRVDRLILECPIGLVDYRRFIPTQSLETLVAAERRLTISAYRTLLKRNCPALAPKQIESYVEWRMRVAQSGEFDRFCKAAGLIQQMVYREPVRNEFEAVVAPTLMIIGEKDQTAPMIHYAPPDMAAKMPMIPQAASDAVKGLQKGSLHVMSGIGHVPHLEAPEAFREKMLAFLLA